MAKQSTPTGYAILCTPNYYAGDIYHMDQPYLVCNRRMRNDETDIVLAARGDADTLCKVLSYGDGEPADLDHNQYAPPQFGVVPYRGVQATVTLLQAVRVFGYGYSDEGLVLPDAALRAKIDRMTSAA